MVASLRWARAGGRVLLGRGRSALATAVRLFAFVAMASSAVESAAAFAASGAAATPSPPSSTPLLANKNVCIAGAGPCGLFLAALLLARDPTVRVTILERAGRNPGGANAFGLGLGPRLVHALGAIPDLQKAVASVGAPSNAGFGIAARSDLVECMTDYLIESDADNRCTVRFGEGCADIDFDKKELTTTIGRRVRYDLLVGADGINSAVRRGLVDSRGLKEVHYLEPKIWKALRLPPQPDFEPASMVTLAHPLVRGRLLPRIGGHIILAFWDADAGEINPGNIDTVEGMKEIFTDALQDAAPKRQVADKKTVLLGSKVMLEKLNDEKVVEGNVRKITFDEEAVKQFVETRPGRGHYMKTNRFHDSSGVALIGDAAHGMNTLLGQGAAMGLKDAEVLVDELSTADGSTGIEKALQRYSKREVREAHALTDLNHAAGVLMRAGPVLKALLMPIILLQKALNMTIFQRVSDVNVPYRTILRQNWFLIPFAKFYWRKQRTPFVRRA